MKLALVIFVLTTSTVAGQTPAYEVAAIKPNTSGARSSSSRQTPGQSIFVNRSLKSLIERAFDSKPFEVSGPEWMESVHFDITAKYPAGTTERERSLMLRALLEERFHLKTHVETKDIPGYLLVAAKSGFKLKPVEPGPGDSQSGGSRVRNLNAKRMSMESLADVLARELGQPVIDGTKIEGVYDIDLIWSETDGDSAPSLFTAVQETLGLRLQPQKAPVGVVIVDNIDKMPADN